MPELKHTPGPWLVDHIFDEESFDIVLGYEVPQKGNPIIVATVFADDDTQPSPHIDRRQADANARLIAAGPEMLEALINVEKCLRGEGALFGQESPGLHGELLRKIVYPAIAKATGKI